MLQPQLSVLLLRRCLLQCLCVKGILQFLIFVEFFFSHGKAVSELREMNIVTSFCMYVKLKIYIVKGGQKL